MADWSELNRLAEAATPGPWKIHDPIEHAPGANFGVDSAKSEVVVWWGSGYNGIPVTADAEFIAAANPAVVLALIAENERLDHLAEAVNGAMHEAGILVDADPVELADAIHKLQVRAAAESQAARYWRKRFDEDTTEAIDQLKAENERLRRIISDSATACGAAMSTECTVEFMGYLPVEIAGVLKQLRASLAAEQRRAAVLEQNCAEMAEALERVRADAERYRGVRRVANSQGYTDEQFDAQTDAQTDARIAHFEVAMGKGGDA
ncbi:hypothetical protein SAMN04244579_02695 [Azotobacter beijerinckii]|uniref:Ead/Ea22-like family protein n=1 Tax=Azotobacter beijerinckii TaxID=170623 RepID=A0A1H6VCX6_9GAMM|nr:hypothetical protein [Azotobacter beijerinckii]SEI98480.1 hypothetical protein SAMN04244579_02695 [Azotobacter beijerinckii]